MGNRRVILSVVVTLAVVPLLAACHPDPPSSTSTPKPTSTPAATKTATPTPTPKAAVFVAPTDCEQLLGAALVAQITSDGHELFSSSDGSGLYYPNDPKQQGGFQCQYGVNYVDYSTFEIDAQALTQQAHEGVIATLDAGGFDKTIDGDVVTYTQVGDEGVQPLYIHVVRSDGWLTGWSSLGGEQQRGLIVGYLATAAQQVYK